MTLSRQFEDLEEQLNMQLSIHGNRMIALTEEWMLLRKRMEEIVRLGKKTEDKIFLSDDTAAGDIFIMDRETNAVRFFAKVEFALLKEMASS